MDVTPEADEVHPVKDPILHQGNLHRPRDVILDLRFWLLLGLFLPIEIVIT